MPLNQDLPCPNCGQQQTTVGAGSGPHYQKLSCLCGKFLKWLPKPELRYKNIPQALKELPQWVCWRLESRGGKTTKIPYDPACGSPAKSNDWRTWSTFNHAWEGAKSPKYHGIGFCFLAGDGLFGVDLDNCRDGDRREEAIELLDRFRGTYQEITPSGNGVRIFGFGKPERCGKGTTQKWIEVYSAESRRYLTVTGQRIAGAGTEISEQKDALLWLTVTYFGPKKEQESPAVNDRWQGNGKVLPDDEILAEAIKAQNGRKFYRLFANGEFGDYPSQSEADLALCAMLRFWTDDPEQIDRLFRRSALMRPKWEVKGYASRTIGRIISGPGAAKSGA